MLNLRLATRMLWRNPAATSVIALTLAVAIGVSTIIASTVDSVWHALPVADTGRLIFVSSTDPRPGEARAGMVGDVAITLVVLAASYLPARRASRVDPVIALRAE